MKKVGLKVSEMFSSIQGEGFSAGVPAVFLRLSGCVLNCVWCDTYEVWRKGHVWELEKLVSYFQAHGYIKALKDNNHSLIVTGGDPLIQEPMLLEFLQLLSAETRLNVEVETEGVIMPKFNMYPCSTQWNVSPKLSNSGMPLSRRYKPDVLSAHVVRHNSWFKFPVKEISDVAEVEEIVRQANIPRECVYLMPVCNSREELLKQSVWVATVCNLKGFRFSSRHQAMIWDKLTGV